MKQLSMMIDMDRCIGCKACIVACRNHHGLVDHDKAMPGDIPYYLRVESKMEGTYPDISAMSWVVPCQQCKKTPCAKVCDSGAITKDEQTGIVRIDRDKCTGSKKCIEACPYGVIQFNEAGGYAHKCEMCFDRIHAGELPVCAEVCLTDAISFGEKEILAQRALDAGLEIVKKLSAQSILYVRKP